MECFLEHDSEVSHLCCVCCVSYRRFALRQVRQNAVFKRKRRERDTENTKKRREREYFHREIFPSARLVRVVRRESVA